MSGSIKQYKGNVFTNDGQSTVERFKDKLTHSVTQALDHAGTAQKKLEVYVGYHGSEGGTTSEKGAFLTAFNSDEMTVVSQIASLFKNVKLIECDKGVSEADIRTGVNRGNVFFTWCDSDAIVNRIMGNDMPEMS